MWRIGLAMALVSVITVALAWGADTADRASNVSADAASPLEVIHWPDEDAPACSIGTSCLEDRRAAMDSASHKDESFTWPLTQLRDANAALWTQGRSVTANSVGLLPKALRDLAAARMLRIDELGRVQIYVLTEGPASAVAQTIQAEGGEVQRVVEEFSTVQAMVPVQLLGDLADTPGVNYVRLPDYAIASEGSVTTEGDALLNAASARSSLGIDGSGVTVGVISDGVGGLSASQASGDLPAVDTATCNVFGGDPGAPGAEGTAMLEIVHDLAPGAELMFGNFGFATSFDFMAAVDCLADHADVVVDDIGFYNVGSYDGTSSVSVNASSELNDATNQVRGYYTAVGNDALNHYEDPFVDTGSGLHVFSATAQTFDVLPFGARPDNPVVVPAGAVTTILLQWDDPFGGSCNDYDLRAWEHDTAVLIASSLDPQSCSQNPTERLAIENLSDSAAIADITINAFSASPRTFDMFILDGLPNFVTPCSSVSNNADAGGGVVALGAIDAADPGTNDIEPFSSCGPTNDGRTKPDVAAIDGVSVTGSGGFPVPFFGTSAAAPHAAGIAALLLDCDPSLTRSELRNAMLNTTVDRGSAGADNVFGSGRLDALAAASSVGCSAEPPAPTPTPCPPEGCSGLDFSMGVDTNGDGTADCDSTSGPFKCTLDPTQTFTVNIYLNRLPADVVDYEGLQFSLVYTGVTSKDNASTEPWPECAFSAASYVNAQGNPIVLWGCASFNNQSTHLGLVGTSDFNCASSGVITMKHSTVDTSLSSSGEHAEGDGTTEELQINCGEEPVATPTEEMPGPNATPSGPPATTAPPTATPTHTPQSAGCAEDLFEDNDSQAGAAGATLPFSETGLRVCPGDVDWFAFPVTLGEQLVIDAFFSHAEGNISIALYTSGFALIETANSSSDNERIRLTARTSAYAVSVRLLDDTGVTPGNSYDLHISTSAAPVATATPTNTPVPSSSSVLVGDVSCDGNIDPIDANWILQFWVRLVSALPCEDGADADGSGVISIQDATLILQYSAGLVSTLPPTRFAGTWPGFTLIW